MLSVIDIMQILHDTSWEFMSFMIFHNLSLYFIVLRDTSIYFMTLHDTWLYFVICHDTSLYFMIQYCMVLRDTSIRMGLVVIGTLQSRCENKKQAKWRGSRCCCLLLAARLFCLLFARIVDWGAWLWWYCECPYIYIYMCIYIYMVYIYILILNGKTREL